MQQQSGDWAPSDSLTLRIWDLAALVEQSWAEVLEPFDLSPVQFRVLAICFERQNCTATEIASLAPLDPAYISRIVQRLFEKGLVTRRRSETDRRVVYLSLTPEGQAQMEELQRPLNDFGFTITQDLSQDVIIALTSSMAYISARLNPTESD